MCKRYRSDLQSTSKKCLHLNWNFLEVFCWLCWKFATLNVTHLVQPSIQLQAMYSLKHADKMQFQRGGMNECLEKHRIKWKSYKEKIYKPNTNQFMPTVKFIGFHTQKVKLFILSSVSELRGVALECFLKSKYKCNFLTVCTSLFSTKNLWYYVKMAAKEGEGGYYFLFVLKIDYFDENI